MDATKAGQRGRGRRGLTPAALLAIAAAWANGAEAAPIRHGAGRLAAQGLVAPRVLSVGVPAAWTNFLAAGETAWASRQSPAFTLPVRRALLSLLNSGAADAASSPLVQYFVWRRNLDPARFDFYHPLFGPSLPQEATPPASLVVPPITVAPLVPDPPLPPPVAIVVPPTVPEPSGLVVMGVMLAVGCWGRRRLS